MRTNSLRTAATATVVAIAVSCFGTLAYAAQSAHPAAAAAHAGSAPTRIAPSTNDPWD